MGICSSSKSKNQLSLKRHPECVEPKRVSPQEDRYMVSTLPAGDVTRSLLRPSVHLSAADSDYKFPLDSVQPQSHLRLNVDVKTASQPEPFRPKLFILKERDGLVHRVPLLQESLEDSSIIRRRLSSNSPDQSSGNLFEASPKSV